MFFENIHLADGTCFFWLSNNKPYLVTNWHNVTGKNPLTDKHLNENLAEPDRIKFDAFNGGDINNRCTIEIPLKEDDRPLWMEHPIHGKRVDVICIELPAHLSSELYFINNLTSHDPLTTVISDNVFILGYPLGFGIERFPIWKVASIASEPEINVDKLPMCIVDTASTKGMSGSPVIRHAPNGGMTQGGSLLMNGQPITSLFGIYSGRIITEGKTDHQLGIVWKPEVIEEIIAQ
jgi:hypothetical protein